MIYRPAFIRSDKEFVLWLLRCGPVLTCDFTDAGLGASYRARISDLRKEGWQIDCDSKIVNGDKHTVWRLRFSTPSTPSTTCLNNATLL